MVQVINPKAISRSIRRIPKVTSSTMSVEPIGGTSNLFFATVAQSADEFEPFWGNLKTRDAQLRKFWVEEPILASAIYSIVSARVAFGWKIDGPPKTVTRVQHMLQSSDLGDGWQSLMHKISIDLLTQDNGAFAEIIRTADSPTSPVVNIAWLDAARCERTRDPRRPVIYTSEEGKKHLLKWYQVLTFWDMPFPSTELSPRQPCFLTRVLRAAQIIRDIGIYKREKVSGRFNRVLHLVGGAKRSEIEDAKRAAHERADNQGLSRYMEPIIMASLDPTASVSHVKIDLASLPDGFNEDVTFKWYIVQLAMGAGADFQDFAPLMSGGLGTSQQSEILHRKARAKGHTMYQKMWEHKLTFCKVLPPSVQFSFEQLDTTEETEVARLKQIRAQTRGLMIASGEITPLIARQIAADDGDLKEEYLAIMGEDDLTPILTLPDDERNRPFVDGELPPQAPPMAAPGEGGQLPPEEIITIEQTDTTQSQRLRPREIPLLHLGEFKSREFIADQAKIIAKWWREVIDTSPAQLANPIMDSKLDVFEFELAKWIRIQESTLITNEYLLDANPLTVSAVKGGINPRELQLRIPGFRATQITSDSINIWAGNKIIKKLPVKTSVRTQKTHTQTIDSLSAVLQTPNLVHTRICMECGKYIAETPVVYHRALSGWRVVCPDHKVIGVMGKYAAVQPTRYELAQQYLSQIKQALPTVRGQLSNDSFENARSNLQLLITSGTSLAYTLGSNGHLDVDGIQESVIRQMDIVDMMLSDIKDGKSHSHWIDLLHTEWLRLVGNA